MGNVATAKQTGQGGTSYEDKVAAYFMACMLSEHLPFDPLYGLIKKVDLQVRSEGWLFDDILLTLAAQEKSHRVAISIKSNQQFNSNGCPVEINNLIWLQYLQKDSSVFNKENDALCLVEAPIITTASENLNQLLRHAVYQEPQILHQQVLTNGFFSETSRKIYKSFYCPENLSTLFHIKAEDTGDLLKCFLHVELDFEKRVSKDEARIIDLCKNSLKNKNQEEAVRLYNALCLIPRKIAPVAGGLDRKSLVRLLQYEFELLNAPMYAADWEKLKQSSEEKLSIIPDKLGTKLTIDRTSLLKELDKNLQENRGLIIQGISGSGKTNLAKLFALTKSQMGNLIWLDSTDFDSDSLESALRLRNSLSELIEEVSDSNAYLFIDGAELLYQERQQHKLAILIQKALIKDSAWKLIFTCPSDQVDKLRQLLIKYNINPSALENFHIPVLTIPELLLIGETYPLIEQILFSSSMVSTRNNLKLLDKLIRNLNNISRLSTTNSLGETQLIDFVWAEEIDAASNGLQISHFLKNLSEHQADLLSIGISTHLFSAGDLVPADTLKSAGFIRLKQEKLYFSHDLYGDWARYKVLKSHAKDLPVFLKPKDLTSPLWARALRLYGISLLEQETEGDSWEKTYQLFTESSAQHLLAKDLLLEAFFFAPGASDLLNSHKELLFAKDCFLFKQMTKLFQIRATQSDPQIISLAKELGIPGHQASLYSRMPIYNFWPDFIKFLCQESEVVLKHDLLSTVRIVSIWLEKTPGKFPMRIEAGMLCLKSAEIIVSVSEKGGYVEDSIAEPVYKALLLSHDEYQESVKSLCLRICKRNKNNQEPGSDTTKSSLESTSSVPLDKFTPREVAPWPLGPFERVDGSFRKVCLETNSLIPIFKLDPPLGSQILLATLIKEPKDRWQSRDRFDHDYGIIEEHGWYPPFYLRGPFLNFLKNAPFEALSFVCKLTDFATEQWKAEQDDPNKQSDIVITTGSEKRIYMGNFDVFGWHKGFGNAPHSLVSVLMALEEFFYEELDRERKVEEYVTFLIKNSNSLAVIGVLFTIGKFNLQLFLRDLKPFIAEYQFYEWDKHSAYHDFTNWGDFSAAWHEQVKKWKDRKHRNYSLKNILLHLIFNNKEFQVDFIPVREKWEKELKELQIRGERDVFLFQLVHQSNPENYEKKITDGNTYYEYKEPPVATEHLAKGRKASLDTLEDSHLAFKYQLMIDNKDSLDLTGTEELWRKIQEIYSTIDTSSQDYCSGENAWASPYTNLLAGIKLLLQHINIWIDIHPKYRSWILDILESIIEKQFLWDGEFKRHGTYQDWNTLLSEVVTVLWKENTEDKKVRKMVAGVLMLFNHETLKSFFQAAAANFSWNDIPFVEAQNLLLHYSGKYYEVYKNRQREPSELRTIRNKLVIDFVEGKISSKAIDWALVRSSEQWMSKKTESWHRNKEDLIRRPGLDTDMVKMIIEAIPTPSGVQNKNEKDYILLLLGHAYYQIIYQAGEIKESSLVIKSIDSKFENIVLKKVASFILQIDNEEKQRAFWEPLFGFGYIAQDWIRTFCNYFYVNLDIETDHPKMVTLLNEMVEFTYTSPTWLTKHLDRREDFRICVLGLHPWIRDMWKHDYSTFTNRADHIYKKWFQKKQYNPYVIDALLGFIITPSGAFMVKDGLTILATFFRFSLLQSQQQPPFGSQWVGHKELDDKLASVLSSLWENSKDNIKSDNASYIQFRELIQYLIAMKNVIGIELQNNLVE